MRTQPAGASCRLGFVGALVARGEAGRTGGYNAGVRQNSSRVWLSVLVVVGGLLAGVVHPEGLIIQVMVLVLRSRLDHPRNVLRLEATRQILMVEGFNTDILDGTGSSAMAHQWTALHFGDYVAYYLAMAYGVDPTPIPSIESLKRRLADSAGA